MRSMRLAERLPKLRNKNASGKGTECGRQSLIAAVGMAANTTIGGLGVARETRATVGCRSKSGETTATTTPAISSTLPIPTRERCRRPCVVCTDGERHAFDPDRFVSKINHHAIDGTRPILLSSLRTAARTITGVPCVAAVRKVEPH